MEEHNRSRGYASMVPLPVGDPPLTVVTASNPCVAAVGDSCGSPLLTNVMDAQSRSIHGFAEGGSYLSLLACLAPSGVFQDPSRVRSMSAVDLEVNGRSSSSPSSTNGSEEELVTSDDDESRRHYDGDESDTGVDDMQRRHNENGISSYYSLPKEVNLERHPFMANL
uniref:Uncharacterized protein n=1 Tax=Arundo donax TaxID=35708 RepID=A0A0A9F7N0_ARUDO